MSKRLVYLTNGKPAYTARPELIEQNRERAERARAKQKEQVR